MPGWRWTQGATVRVSGQITRLPSFILIFVCFFLCCLKAQHGHWPVGEKEEERRKKEKKKRLSESARVLMCVTWPNTGTIFFGNHSTLIEIRVSLDNSESF